MTTILGLFDYQYFTAIFNHYQLNKKFDCLKTENQEEKEQYFISDIKKYLKVIKCVSTPLCIIFTITTLVITLITGFKSWFELPFKDNWWVWIIAVIFTIGSIIGAILNGTNNKWLEHQVNKKERKLADKYKINLEWVEKNRKKYWNKR